MQLEWDGVFYLVPSVDAAGTSPGLEALPFNIPVSVGTVDLGIFLLDSARCQAGSARRITRNNLAQADGEITHRKFKTGYVFELNAQLWETVENPACAGTLREMADVLGEYLEAAANADAQLIWFPGAWPEGSDPPNPRILDLARSMGPSGSGDSGFVSVVTEKGEDAQLFDVTFALLSPLPYVTDFMNYPSDPDETATFATGLGDESITITNDGNTAFFPVIQVYGPATEFILINESVLDEIGNPLRIAYDSSQIGALPIAAGQYVEIDCFRNTVKLHLAGGGTDNAKSGIVVPDSDFFPLEPGANNLVVTDWAFDPGSKIDILYRNAWV